MATRQYNIPTEARVPVAEPLPDPFTDADIPNLCHANFKEFLQENDITLVMFYEPGDENSSLGAQHLIQASQTVTRPYAAFAAVDCLANRELCRANNVLNNIPMYILYSGNTVVGTFRDVCGFTATCMKNFMENAPVLTRRV